MRVCYFGTYDASNAASPDAALAQSRNQIIIQGLRANDVEVVECHVRLWRDTEDKLRMARGGWRSPRLLARILAAYLRLLARYGRVGSYDVMVVGYAGHLDVFLARLLTLLARKPLVYDIFIPITEILVEDRQLVHPDSIMARLLRWVDRTSCRLADVIFVDTGPHARYYRDQLGVDPARMRYLPVGAPEVYGNHPSAGELHRLYPPSQRRGANHSESFRVLYFGQFVPLHGVETIIEAADLLRDHGDVRFELVGEGQTYTRALNLARTRGLTNVAFHHTWLPAAELIERHILPADVCLGIFGGGGKAQRVVPYKVYVALAMGKPLITGDTPAAREVLVHGQNALLCPVADPHALAEAILTLQRDPALRQRLSVEAQRTYRARFSPQVIGAAAKDHLSAVVQSGVSSLALDPSVTLRPGFGSAGAGKGSNSSTRQDLPVPAEQYSAGMLLTFCGQEYEDFLSSGGKVLRPRVARALALADVRPGMRVLDIGCGRGEAALHAAMAGATVVGLDFSADCLRLTARTLGLSPGDAGRVSRIRADATGLPLADGTVDRVLLLDVVEHLWPWQLATTLEEVRRVLKPCGRVVIHTTPNRWAFRVGYPLFRLMSRWLLRQGGLPQQPRAWYERTVHVNEQDIISLKRSLRRAGLAADVWVEDQTSAQAVWQEGRHFPDRLREHGYPILRRPLIRTLVAIVMRTPLRIFFANDIYAIAWRTADNR